MFGKSEIERSLRKVKMQYNAWLSTSFRAQERRRWRNFQISPKLKKLTLISHLYSIRNTP